MNEFEAIGDLKSLASTSGSIGATNELQSAWNEWDLVRGEAGGDKVERKRSEQLSLAGMDFRRQKLYVIFVRHPNAGPLKDAHRQHSMEYFHVCLNLASSIYISQRSVRRRAPMRLCPSHTDGAAMKMSLSGSHHTRMNNCPRSTSSSGVSEMVRQRGRVPSLYCNPVPLPQDDIYSGLSLGCKMSIARCLYARRPWLGFT